MTREIPLTQGKFAVVDDEDYERVMQYTWSYWRGYATRWVSPHTSSSRHRSMHRFILDAPPGRFVDHKNGDTLDNTRGNLRFATRQENGQNRAPGNGGSSTFKGVSWNRQRRKWASQIGVAGTRRHLGWFTDEKEAARVYDAAARELFGEFARLNFPEGGAG